MTWMKSTIATVVFFISFSALCQDQRKNTKIVAETGFFYSNNGVAPFWMKSNTFGEVPKSTPNLQIKLSVYNEYDSTLNKISQLRKKIDWAYGISLVNNYTTVNKFTIQEAFIKSRWKSWELYVGRRKEIFGLIDSTNTSGSYIWSGNALPMPKIQLHTPGYISLGRKGLFSFKAGISHSWFGKDSIVQGHFLHQKWLYGRIGRHNSNFKFYAGMNHQVMWGGYSEILKSVQGPTAPTIDGYLAPYPLYSFQYVLIPFLQKIIPPDNTKVPLYDAGLAIGNQLGSIDIGFEFNINKYQFYIGKQQPFDFARSVKNLNNIEDGLYTLSISNPFKAISRATIEFFYSKSQGRYRFGEYRESNYGEVDNYFSHGVYQSWSYQGNIIGTPFVQKTKSMNSRITNNRVKYIYLSLSGDIKSFKYNLRQSFSWNYGTYSSPFFAKQYSLGLKVVKNLSPSLSLVQGLSLDKGHLFSENWGGHSAIRWTVL